MSLMDDKRRYLDSNDLESLNCKAPENAPTRCEYRAGDALQQTGARSTAEGFASAITEDNLGPRKADSEGSVHLEAVHTDLPFEKDFAAVYERSEESSKKRGLPVALYADHTGHAANRSRRGRRGGMSLQFNYPEPPGRTMAQWLMYTLRSHGWNTHFAGKPQARGRAGMPRPGRGAAESWLNSSQRYQLERLHGGLVDGHTPRSQSGDSDGSRPTKPSRRRRSGARGWIVPRLRMEKVLAKSEQNGIGDSSETNRSGSSQSKVTESYGTALDPIQRAALTPARKPSVYGVPGGREPAGGQDIRIQMRLSDEFPAPWGGCSIAQTKQSNHEEKSEYTSCNRGAQSMGPHEMHPEEMEVSTE